MNARSSALLDKSYLFSEYPTDPSTTVKLRNPSQDISELHKISRSPDLEALKFWKSRSGVIARFSENFSSSPRDNMKNGWMRCCCSGFLPFPPENYFLTQNYNCYKSGFLSPPLFLIPFLFLPSLFSLFARCIFQQQQQQGEKMVEGEKKSFAPIYFSFFFALRALFQFFLICYSVSDKEQNMRGSR